MELSLCMIVKDEEEHLPACLDSVRAAVDEMVILDTGSKDRTKEIALRYTDRVYDYDWQDDFSAARNASMFYASKPYILWLDADDVMDPPQREKLIALKERLDGSVDAVMLPYQYAFSSDGQPSLVFMRERIVRREAGFCFCGAVHEAMSVGGHVIDADVVIRHTGCHGEKSNRRNLAIYKGMIARGEKMTLRDRYYYARELSSAGDYASAEREFAAFLKTEEGWIEDRLSAYVLWGKCLCALGRHGEARDAYLRSMSLCAPRAEALAALGDSFLEENELHAAAFWYRSALHCPVPKAGGFVSVDSYGYIPLMQLCLCYARMGENLLASQMNEQALLKKPDDPAALANRAYFQRILGQKEQEAMGQV